ncbi:MAG: response regulator [Nitrospiraceae bacterium]|nr:MAG: response regulator [Nitrospiraceae bacterium]
MTEIASEKKPDTPLEILFVDDEKNVLQSLRRLFIDEDYTINLANSGEEALEILKNNPDIGLIVSDQRMPGLKGSEFLEKSKEISPESIRILLTGYADINAVADAINRGGAYRYVTKPWKDEELIQIIRDAARRYLLLKENKRLQEIIRKQNEELKRWNTQLEYFVQEQTIEIQHKSEELQKLNEDLKKNFRNSIFAFSGLIELRDKKTGSHSKNVAELSVKIARAMDLPDKDIETITAAALLHDIGKIGIPDMLLLKDFEEMDKVAKHEYMQHPVRGQTAVDSVEALRPAGILIRHHHEWFNGFGFPDGLSGGKIPVGARIIAVADFVDKSIRNPEQGSTLEIISGKIKTGAGTRFDPQLCPYVEALIKEVYSKILPHGKGGTIEIELHVDEIRDGMVLAKDVKSGTGLTLLPRGTVLNLKNIHSLKRYYELDPSETGIFVLVER